ncbi:restriction endonuclease [Streptomyces sp. NPDC026206]|uniref:restriction endonuclease n=1 Tax=Streptomyces sp. NPDC026206 TaxID=3157089 RepID=UPI0033D5D685
MSVQRAVSPEPSREPADERSVSKRAASKGCFGVILLGVAVWLVIKAIPDWTTPDGEYSMWAVGPFAVPLVLYIGLGLISDLATVREGRQPQQTQQLSLATAPVLLRTWRDAEFLAVYHMQQIGYPDARDTGSGSDGGIDAKATGAVAQVKMKSKPVGRPDVQRLVGAAGRGELQDLLFYSLQGYTAQALVYADSQGVMLFQFDETGAVWAVNRVARSALNRPRN